MLDREKFALVTGCGKGGIGEALVKTYLSRGLHAIATVLPFEDSEHLRQEGITFFKLDVTDEASVVALRKSVTDLTGGHLDILVNCAGIAYTMPAIDTDVKAVSKMFDVNVLGPMRMVHHFHDMLIRSAGTIVNIGSVGGVVPYMYGASYNASKAALHHWSSTLRIEMAPLGVRVITVISGEVATNILKSDVNRELPKGSYYAPMADDFKKHVGRTPDTTDRFTYARNVVAESLKARPSAWFWFGKQTGVVWFFDTFGWRTFWDAVVWRVFSLAKLQKAHLMRMKKGF